MPMPRSDGAAARSDSAPALPDSAEVVVIGGGVMGVSIAYHLAAAGVRDIVLLERDTVGSGSSAKPMGGVRATFSDPGNIILGQRSLQAFERFDETFGTDIGLRQVGYLFLCRTEAEVQQVQRSIEVQNDLGGSSRMVSPEEAGRLNPLLETRSLLAASFSPRDGFAQPAAVVAAYRAAAAELGVAIVEQAEVLDIDAGGAGVRGVVTRRGSIRTGAVVCAAGAWSMALGAMAGVHLPIRPVRRQIGMTGSERDRFPTVPFTLDLTTTLYFHNYFDGMLLGISNEDEEPGFGREFSHDWVPAFDHAADVIAPSLARRELTAGWAGLYENTPDHNAMIGSSATVDGFFYATGFSGHGFLQGPAVGELMRDLYLGVPSFLDPAPFSADRFSTAATRIDEVHII